MDHLDPFPKSLKGYMHLIVVVDAFTKFVFVKAVKSTNSKKVIKYLNKLFGTYGVPTRIISDRGTAFTSKSFLKYCQDTGVKHVKNAVATPRSNGQVERFNRTLLSALSASCENADKWQDYIAKVQFAMNNTYSKSTGKTASELFFGYKPRPITNSILTAEIQVEQSHPRDINVEREEVAEKLLFDSMLQKERFDKKRKPARKYKENDLVVFEKQIIGEGTSKKLKPPYAGPFIVKKVLPNDRYVICDLPGSDRSRRAKYENTVAVDKLKPWTSPGGMSSDSSCESGESDEDLGLESEHSSNTDN